MYQVVSREVPAQRVATIRARVPMSMIGEAADAEIDGLPFAILQMPLE